MCGVGRALAAVALIVVAALMVLLLPSTAWAVVDCGTSANPCVTYVRLDEAQDAALDDIKLAAAIGGGALVFCALVSMIGGWGVRRG